MTPSSFVTIVATAPKDKFLSGGGFSALPLEAMLKVEFSSADIPPSFICGEFFLSGSDDDFFFTNQAPLTVPAPLLQTIKARCLVSGLHLAHARHCHGLTRQIDAFARAFVCDQGFVTASSFSATFEDRGDDGGDDFVLALAVPEDLEAALLPFVNTGITKA